MLPGEESDQLAANAFLFEEFLVREKAAGRLALALQALPESEALLHGHCHQKAFAAVKPIVEQLGASLVAIEDREAGDLPLRWDGAVIAVVRPAPLHGALERMIEAVEREMGAPLQTMSREDKQRAIRLLDERGAFILRRAVEDIADAIGVSRITVYNYLNALHR